MVHVNVPFDTLGSGEKPRTHGHAPVNVRDLRPRQIILIPIPLIIMYDGLDQMIVRLCILPHVEHLLFRALIGSGPCPRSPQKLCCGELVRQLNQAPKKVLRGIPSAYPAGEAFESLSVFPGAEREYHR